MKFNKLVLFADELVIFVAPAILVVNGVRHVDCVTFSSSSFYERGNKRNIFEKKERAREKERKRKRGRGRGLKNIEKLDFGEL